MLAVTCRRYGPPEVLKIEEVARPTLKANEVLVRVRASSVTSGDVRMRAFTGAGIFWLPMRLLFGVLRPRNPITGMEFAGTVAAVGQGATAFRVGDAVFGMKIGGANAEYLAVREASAIAATPEGLTFRRPSCRSALCQPWSFCETLRSSSLDRRYSSMAPAAQWVCLRFSLPSISALTSRAFAARQILNSSPRSALTR